MFVWAGHGGSRQIIREFIMKIIRNYLVLLVQHSVFTGLQNGLLK